mgnify:CR=1 FL=1
MNANELKRLINNVADFPSPGILFRDISPLLADGRAYRTALDQMAEQLAAFEWTAIAGIEARGFIFAAPLAATLGKPFYPVRKAGKLPVVGARASYDLEYGRDRLELPGGLPLADCRIAIVDDVLATGGTALAVKRMLDEAGAQIACLSFLIELLPLAGRRRFGDIPVTSVIRYAADE